MQGKLHIVSTPLGNREDMTYRAIDVLSTVDAILTEDTRVTRNILSKYKIKTPLKSYHAHSADAVKLEILNDLNNGKGLALVTDAGTPGISDPGNELIDFLLENNPEIEIIPIPGPSAVIAALSISGFRTNQFVFIGFMPKKGGKKLFKWLKHGEMTFAYYESPHRVIKSLIKIKENFGDVRVFVGREMTKMHETLYRGGIDEVIAAIKEDAKETGGKIKGEIVVVVENS